MFRSRAVRSSTPALDIQSTLDSRDKGLEVRNTVAHGTVSLALIENDPSLEPQTIGILKVKKWQDTDELMSLEELKNAVNVTAQIANEVNAMLTPSA
jgi:hypothetical protein